MPSPIVTLASATDSITFTGTNPGAGWVYDNATLNSWYRLAKSNPRRNKRPNAHGSYGLGQIFLGSAEPIIVGQYYGASMLDAMIAQQRLSAMFNDGNSITMTVADDIATTSREVWLLEYDPEWVYGFDYFPFDIALEAPDPRRYGSLIVDSKGLPTASSGLVWPLNSGATFWDWGTAGVDGRVQFTNNGIASTNPLIMVGGAGAFATGFRVLEVETGRELTLVRQTFTGEVVVLDSRTGRATINGGDVTGDMTAKQWFTVPPGATRRYQLTTLGSTSGSPTITLNARAAYL